MNEINNMEAIDINPCGYTDLVDFEYSYEENEEKSSDIDPETCKNNKKSSDFGYFDIVFIKAILVISFAVIMLVINLFNRDITSKVIDTYKKYCDSTQVDFIENLNDNIVEWLEKALKNVQNQNF